MPQANFKADKARKFFVYSAYFLLPSVGFTAQPVVTQDITLDGDADFELLGITVSCRLIIGGVPIVSTSESTQLLLNVSVDVLNMSTGRRISNIPQRMPLIAGIGERPLWLPYPVYWGAYSTIRTTMVNQLTVNNPIGNIYFNFIGAKVYG